MSQAFPRSKAALWIPGFAVLALVASPAVGQDWPQFRGPSLDGTASGLEASQPFGLERVWRRPLGSGYSSISVAGGNAATLFADGGDYVAVFDARTGLEVPVDDPGAVGGFEPGGDLAAVVDGEADLKGSVAQQLGEVGSVDEQDVEAVGSDLRTLRRQAHSSFTWRQG